MNKCAQGPGDWKNINDGADEWFMSELSKLDCNNLIATKFCAVHAGWPSGDRLKTFICRVDQYDNNAGTGFEIINFKPVLDWATSVGIGPAALRISVHTEHTDVDDILGKIARVDQDITKKLHELEVEDEFYSDWR